MNSLIKSGWSTLFKAANSCMTALGAGRLTPVAATGQVRTRVTCSRSGKAGEKSVKTAMDRYFRLDKRVWIKAVPGYHHHLYLKPLEKRFVQQQSMLCTRKESKMLERMSGKYYKKLRLERFVDAPFVHYHEYLESARFNKPAHIYP